MNTPLTGYATPRFDQPVKRYCQTLLLRDNPELIEQYKAAHSPAHIWPEIPEGIRTVGILDMEIFLFADRLFMIVTTPLDFEWGPAMARLGSLPRQAEWEAHVALFQMASADAASSEKWQLMERIFSLRECSER